MSHPLLPPRDGRSKLHSVQQITSTNPQQSDTSQFLPWFDRSDLPPNRTSKKRTQKRKPQVLNELICQQSCSVPTVTTTPPPPTNTDHTVQQQTKNVNSTPLPINSESIDRYRTANDRVLNYLKEIQQRQLQQNLQRQHANFPLNVSVSMIKNKLMYQQQPSATVVPNYTLTPTVNDIITQWEKRQRQEELTHEQRLQKERLLRLQQQQQNRRAYSLLNPRTSSTLSTSQNGSNHHQVYKVIPKLNLPPILENNVNSNDMADDTTLSPTSSTSSTCSSVDEDREHMHQVSLPSIAKLHLPPLNLPGKEWDGTHMTPRSAPTPRFDSTNLSPNPSQSNTSSPISSPRVNTTRSGNRSGRSARYNSPRHAPYPSPRPLSSRQLSPMDACSSPLSGPDGNRAQEHISEQQLFEAVFKHTPCAMAIISVHGFFVSVNKSFCELLGLSSEEELNNKNVSSVTCRGEESVFTNQFMHQILMGSNNANNRMHQNFYHRNGSVVECICSVGVVKDVFGHGSFFVMTVVDSRLQEQ
jgi:PAS domain S-box-containing protein